MISRSSFTALFLSHPIFGNTFAYSACTNSLKDSLREVESIKSTFHQLSPSHHAPSAANCDLGELKKLKGRFRQLKTSLDHTTALSKYEEYSQEDRWYLLIFRFFMDLMGIYTPYRQMELAHAELNRSLVSVERQFNSTKKEAPATANSPIKYGGFENSGNTCYLAASLHMLHINSAYNKAFDKKQNPLTQRKGESEEAFADRQALQASIKGAFDLIEEGTSQPEEEIDSIRNLMVKAKVIPGNERRSQQDSSETIVKILDAVDCTASECHVVERSIKFSETRDHKDQKERSDGDSTKEELEGDRKYNHEFIFNLHEVKQGSSISLDDLLERESHVEREVSFYEKDAKSGKLVRKQATQHLRQIVETPPTVLQIYLKQYHSDFRKTRSNKVAITVPEMWSIKLANDTDALYRLTGAIVQSGSRNGGHYTAYTLDPESIDHFYHFNDGEAKRVQKDAALKWMSTAYCLFFERVKTYRRTATLSTEESDESTTP